MARGGALPAHGYDGAPLAHERKFINSSRIAQDIMSREQWFNSGRVSEFSKLQPSKQICGAPCQEVQVERSGNVMRLGWLVVGSVLLGCLLAGCEVISAADSGDDTKNGKAPG